MIGMLNPTALLVGALAVSLLTGGAYIKGRQDGNAIARADQGEVLELARKVRDDAQRGAAEAIAQIEIKHVTIRQQIEREVRENIVYRECVHPADQLQRINAAITGRPAERAGDRKLPRLDAVER